MKDITRRVDLEILMAKFYGKLLADPEMGYIFTDVAKINLDEHLPHVVDFWEQNILNSGTYRNNVMAVHQQLSAKHQLTQKHFSTWLRHFETTVDEDFTGSNAQKIKTRALSIATIMQIKL